MLLSLQVEVLKYTDEEYRLHLDSDKAWTKDQTDRLFEAVRRFDLRWPVIADRLELGPNHPLPDIKNRFYSVTSKIIALRCGGRPCFYHPPNVAVVHVLS
jgi:hypothetical protein